jgi:hypothetical protein
MTRQTWAVLQTHEVTEKSKLRLDFYNAPSREAAEALCTLLQEQTDYDVRVESSGSLFRRRWRIEGTAQETAVPPAIFRAMGHMDGHCWERTLM